MHNTTDPKHIVLDNLHSVAIVTCQDAKATQRKKASGMLFPIFLRPVVAQRVLYAKIVTVFWYKACDSVHLHLAKH